MPGRSTARLVWLVQVEEQHGMRFIRAHVVRLTGEGELLTMEWDRPADRGNGREFADFRVQCYLGQPDYVSDGDRGQVWGLVHEFTPFRVECAEHARAMAAVFGRVFRGLARAERELGGLPDGDFVGYLLRVGAALGIRTYYVRNHPQQRDSSGERFRTVTPSGLQWWLGETQTIARERPSDLRDR
jgi:hypothetical protein